MQDPEVRDLIEEERRLDAQNYKSLVKTSNNIVGMYK